MKNRRHWIGLAVLLTASLTLDLSPTRRALGADDAAANAKERQKWEDKVVFFGEEDTGHYSIRILDRAATEAGNFKYFSLWKYDLEKKDWVKVDDHEQSVHFVLPRDKPQNAPDDSQLLAQIPVSQETVGLYYARWSVNDVNGATFCRVGPGFVGKVPKFDRVPDGMMAAEIPVDKNKAVIVLIPDPRKRTSDK